MSPFTDDGEPTEHRNKRLDEYGDRKVRDVKEEIKAGMQRMFMVGRAIGMATTEYKYRHKIKTTKGLFIDGNFVIKLAQHYLEKANQPVLDRNEIIIIKSYMKDFTIEQIEHKMKEKDGDNWREEMR